MNEQRKDIHPEGEPAQELPTAPLVPHEAEQTLPTLDAQGTVSLDASALQQPVSFYTASTQQAASPSPLTRPAQGYGQGSVGNASNQVFPPPYPDTTQAAPQFSDPAYLYVPGSAALQPGQPAPGAFPIRKRRRTTWLVAILLLALLLVGGGAAFAVVRANASTPTQTLLKLCDGLKTQNVQEVYDTFSSAAKAKNSLADLQQGFATLKDLLHVKFTACTVGSVQENGATASGQLTLTTQATLLGITSSITSTPSVDLVQENGAWKVNANTVTNIPNVTLPTVPTFPTPTTSNQ